MASININSVNSEAIYYGGELPEVVKIGYESGNSSIFTDLNKNGYVDYEDFKDEQFAKYLSDNGYLGTLWNTFKDIVENLYKQFKSENAENAIAEDVEQVELEKQQKEPLLETEIVISNDEMEKISQLKQEIVARKKELSKSPRDPYTNMWAPEVREEYNNLDKKMTDYYEQLKQPETEGELLRIKDENGNILIILKAIKNSEKQNKLGWMNQF